MGMPISNYTVFKALTDKNYKSMEFKLARDCFSDFNLLAFVIYDPEKHKEFFNKLTNSFNVLDKKTGDKLLFFAVCNAPENWDEKVANRSYSGMYNWAKEQFDKHNLSNNNLHNSDAAYAIARAFKIESNNLPCIIVTNNFEKRDFCWFKTCPEHIELQLINLAYIAEEYPILKEDWKNAKEIMINKQHNVDLCNGFGYMALSESLAETLSTVLAFLEAVCSSDEEIRKRAKQDILRELRKLQMNISIIKKQLKSSGKAYNQQFEDLNMKVASLISILDTEIIEVPNCINQNKSYMEIESFNNIHLGMKVYNLFNDSKKLKYFIGDNKDEINLVDFTPAIICLAKAFEREIGLSLGHTVRKYVGVNLPKYYNKYDRELGKGNSSILPDTSLVPNPTSIEFNNGKQGVKWIPPGIGQMLLAVKTLVLQSYTDMINVTSKMDDHDRFFKTWKDIMEKRNQCAHTEYMENGEAAKVKEDIESLANSNIFKVLNDCKLQHKLVYAKKLSNKSVNRNNF